MPGTSRQVHLKRELVGRCLDAGIPALSTELVGGIVNLQNRARGDLFELVACATLASQLRDDADDMGRLVFARHQRFETTLGSRFVDLYFPGTGIAVEVKSGYACGNRSTLVQVQKDRLLLGSACTDVHWLLFRGASSPLIAALGAAGISWTDLEWDYDDRRTP